MPSRKPTDLRRGDTQEKQFDWFKNAASQPSQCDAWDVKTQALADAILGLLSRGKGIQFGTTRDGSSIYVTLYDGDSKDRKYIGDSIEFDDTIELINSGLHRLHVLENESKVRAIGD